MSTDSTKHTPGEWKCLHDSDGDFAIFGGDKLLAVTTSDTPEDEANAKFFAASKEMLSALKADNALLMKLAPLVFKAEIAEHLPFGLKEEVENWLKQSAAQAAISKAEVKP